MFHMIASNASEIASLRESVRLINRIGHHARRRMTRKSDEEVGALGLMLLGLVGTLVEKGVITREELIAQLRKVDEIDGAADGKVTPEQVQAALGIARPDPGPKAAPVPTRKRR